MRALIGMAAIALLASACGEASPGATGEEDAADANGQESASLDECEPQEAFDIDFTEEAEQPTAKDALQAYLDDPPRDMPVPAGEPHPEEATDGRVEWSFVDDRGAEVGILQTERRQSGGWTVVGGRVCASALD